MDNRNKVKRYSKIYKSVPKKRSVAYYIFSYSFTFIVVATVAYLGSMAVNSFLNRPHCTEIGPLEEVLDDNENKNEAAEQPQAEEDASDKNNKLIEEVNMPVVDYNNLQINGEEVDLAILSSKDKLEKFLGKLKKDENNAVVVCLKNGEGKLLYNSELNQAEQWKTVVGSKVDFKEITTKIKEEGLVPVARISAFFDQTAPSVERDNSFVLSNGKLNWFNSGKGVKKGKWLDATNPAVQDYIVDIAVEITKLGFDNILIDNAFFPMFKTKQETDSFSDYDEEARFKALNEFLAKLVKKKVNAIFSYPVGVFYDDDLAKSLFGNLTFVDKVSAHAPIVENEAELKKSEDALINLAANKFVAIQLLPGSNKASTRKKVRSYAIKSIVAVK